MATNTKIVQTPAVALYSPVSPTATSAVITPYPKDLDGVKLTMSDFGTLPNATFDPKVSGYEEIVSFTGLIDNGDGTGTLTGITRDLQSKYPYTGSGTGKQHGSSAVVVFSNNPQVQSRYPARDNDEIISGQWTFLNFPITPATPLATTAVAGMTRMSVAPANPLIPIAVGANDTTTFAPIAYQVPVGAEMPFAGLTVPAGWLSEDASAVSRTTYAALWAALSKSQTFTVTIAAPGVFTATAHGLLVGQRVRLTTTGGLPSGLTAITTDYYIVAANFAANTFSVAAAPGGTAITTTGSQSGTHTWTYAPFGHGDGTTTFNVPDRRGRVIVGAGTGTKTITILSVAGNVFTANHTVGSNNEMQTGEAVVFNATVAGNLVNATTYYVVRVGNNTFSLATTLVNAQNGTVITLAGTETGSFTLTFSARAVGDTGGEENHAMSSTELLAHTHLIPFTGGAGARPIATAPTGNSNAWSPTDSTGGNAAMNIMAPFGVSNYIIKT